jgi:hypothetical protein
MEVTLRRKPAGYGGWWRGLGDLESELIAAGIDPADAAAYSALPAGSLESQLIAAGIDPADAAAYSALPGGSTGMPAAGPAPDLTPAELAAEQARATTWLAQNTTPAILKSVTGAALTAAQIASGLTAGAVKPSSTCPSGYLLAGTGQCVISGAPGASVVAGLPNSTLLMIGGGFLLLMILSKSGGRR